MRRRVGAEAGTDRSTRRATEASFRDGVTCARPSGADGAAMAFVKPQTPRTRRRHLSQAQTKQRRRQRDLKGGAKRSGAVRLCSLQVESPRATRGERANAVRDRRGTRQASNSGTRGRRPNGGGDQGRVFAMADRCLPSRCGFCLRLMLVSIRRVLRHCPTDSCLALKDMRLGCSAGVLAADVARTCSFFRWTVPQPPQM